jgi:YfiH family protein
LAEPIDVFRSAALAGVPHAFLGRRGGVSTGEVAGLQVGLGAGDDPAAIAENRRRAAAAVCDACDLATVYQVHSAEVVTVPRPWPERGRPRADAMVCDEPGMLLAIVTADCAPVLFADAEAGVIGAAHAGWRGAHGGVLENTVSAMCELGARRERIAAAIGPTIAQASYEVDEPFRARFEPADARFFAPGAAGRWQFDLPGYIEARLASAGVGRIDQLGLDTYGDPERFYSYRRATHHGEANYGRQFSLIALGPPVR